MLIKAIVENFKSFKNRTELSMITSNKIRDNTEHKKTINSINLLKNAVIYGANASGKSNLVEFFTFFKYCVMQELPLSSTDMFCKLDEENERKNSTFRIEFVIDDKFYDYGFEVLLKNREIKAEWLYELKIGGNASCLFEVDNSTPILKMKNVEKESVNRFNTYAEDYSGTKTSLFLTELNRNKKYSEDSKLLIFKKVYEWITKNIIVFSPDSLITNFEYFYNQKSLKEVNDLISSFDTGISNAKIAKISIEEFKNRVPQEIFKDVMEKIKEMAGQKDLKRNRFSMRSYDSFFNIDFDDKNEPNITTIKLNHDKSIYEYEFEEESDGTRRLFDLIDMLLIKKEKDNVLFVVDELERSLHPKLTERFLTLFNKTHKNNMVQLVFTTHESSIMDQSLFRRDEIWFVERGGDNSSRLYSLDSFKERYDKKLSKSYLEGRYGAIPVFKNFTFED